MAAFVRIWQPESLEYAGLLSPFSFISSLSLKRVGVSAFLLAFRIFCLKERFRKAK